MRVVAGLRSDQIGDADHRAARLPFQPKQLLHPVVVSDPAVNDNVRVLHRLGRRRIGLKFMRVLVRIAENAGDIGGISGDLTGHAAVKIFGGNDIQGLRVKTSAGEQRSNRNGEIFHDVDFLG